jgi:hypothetical protein
MGSVSCVHVQHHGWCDVHGWENCIFMKSKQMDMWHQTL